MSPILRLEALSVSYRVRGLGRPPLRVVEDIDLSIAPGETVALVGESGSGKSTIGNAVLGLVPSDAGRILLDGADVTHLAARERRRLSGTVQAVFQNPYGSLNPWITIGRTLSEPLLAAGLSRSDTATRLRELLLLTHLPEDSLERYPREFSGGQRQRIAIARAVAMRPRLIVCDEPTSALDVVTQAAVLRLLQELQDQSGVAYLFITHDLAVVRRFAQRAVVLERGRIVETGDAQAVCDDPQHAYTKRLVAAAPVPNPVLQRRRRAERAALLADDRAS